MAQKISKDLVKFRLFRKETYLGVFLSGFPVLPTVTVTPYSGRSVMMRDGRCQLDLFLDICLEDLI